jgi:mannosyltransferase OCH1-like enzyme
MALIWNPLPSRCTSAGNFKIPQRMHFLWGFLGDSGDLPAREACNLASWKQLNGGWDHCIHRPPGVESLLTPEVSRLYTGLPTAIQRCDVARPILLSAAGGVYSDLDVQPYRDLNWLCGLYPHAGVILIEEVTLSRASSRRRGNRFPVRGGRPELRLRVANFWMASVAGHPFWSDVLALMEERSDIAVRHDYDVIYTTGPDIISEAFDRSLGKYDDIALVPRGVARRFFRHRTHGSWRKEGTRQTWAA